MKSVSIRKKLLFGIILAFMFIASISLTYAYFSSNISGNEQANNQVVTTGTLSLTYVDGREINLSLIEPGTFTTKTFSVTNTGTYDIYYKIGWEHLLNEIINDELVYSYTCKSYRYYGLETEEEYGTCDSRATTSIGNDVTSTLGNNIFLDNGITHVYELNIEFLEMSSDQNYNQGKTFNGTLNIFESNEAITLRGMVTDNSNNPLSGATVEFHSELRSAVTNEEGIYEVRGVEVGTHTNY